LWLLFHATPLEILTRATSISRRTSRGISENVIISSRSGISGNISENVIRRRTNIDSTSYISDDTSDLNSTNIDSTSYLSDTCGLIDIFDINGANTNIDSTRDDTSGINGTSIDNASYFSDDTSDLNSTNIDSISYLSDTCGLIDILDINGAITNISSVSVSFDNIISASGLNGTNIDSTRDDTSGINGTSIDSASYFSDDTSGSRRTRSISGSTISRHISGIIIRRGSISSRSSISWSISGISSSI
jgi:hypothetical protein